MINQHEPDPDFQLALESDLQSSLRRRRLWSENDQPKRRSLSRSRWRWPAFAMMLVLAVSAGAFSMYAAIHSDDRHQQDLIIAGLETKLNIQQLRIDAPAEALAEAEALVEAGVMSGSDLDERRNDLQMAELLHRRLEIDLSEAVLSGREPDNRLSAPLVEGADFVSKRLLLDRESAAMMLDNAAKRAQRVEERVAAAVHGVHEAEAARQEVTLAEQNVKRVEGKLALRVSFLQGAIGALEAEYGDLRIGAEHRQQGAAVYLERAAGELERLSALADGGYISRRELRRAQLDVAEWEAQRRLADLERALIETRLDAARRERGQ